LDLNLVFCSCTSLGGKLKFCLNRGDLQTQFSKLRVETGDLSLLFDDQLLGTRHVHLQLALAIVL
jgi:hypothetical protein